MHDYFASRLFGSPVGYVSRDQGERTYYSSGGDRVGYSRATAQGAWLHYSMDDKNVGYSRNIRTADPLYPASQLHHLADDRVIGYTKAIRGTPQRLHFSHDDKYVGSTVVGRENGTQQHRSFTDDRTIGVTKILPTANSAAAPAPHPYQTYGGTEITWLCCLIFSKIPDSTATNKIIKNSTSLSASIVR